MFCKNYENFQGRKTVISLKDLEYDVLGRKDSGIRIGRRNRMKED
jgi:hypothetical protein